MVGLFQTHHPLEFEQTRLTHPPLALVLRGNCSSPPALNEPVSEPLGSGSGTLEAGCKGGGGVWG